MSLPSQKSTTPHGQYKRTIPENIRSQEDMRAAMEAMATAEGHKPKVKSVADGPEDRGQWRKTITAYLRANGPSGTRQISDGIKRNYHTTYTWLKLMRGEGAVRRVGYNNKSRWEAVE